MPAKKASSTKSTPRRTRPPTPSDTNTTGHPGEQYHGLSAEELQAQTGNVTLTPAGDTPRQARRSDPAPEGGPAGNHDALGNPY